jgi:hypothetical protein
MTAAASLTRNGATRTVTVTLYARRDGTALEVAGTIPRNFRELGHQRAQAASVRRDHSPVTAKLVPPHLRSALTIPAWRLAQPTLVLQRTPFRP